MRKSRFSEQQIAFALRQAEACTPVTEVCRKMGGRLGAHLLPLEEALRRPDAVRGAQTPLQHRRCRWLNNRIEQDHRRVKRRTEPPPLAWTGA